MSTTVTIPDEQWERLKELAARCGEPNPEELVREAVERMLGADSGSWVEDEAVDLPGYGAIDDRRAEELHRHVRELRDHWRDPPR